MAAPDSGKGKIDDLFQLPLAEFTPARNALATVLKKSGDTAEAERVKALVKPSLSAWVANQLYWHHRTAFDQLITAGDQFRAAQAAQLAGKPADLRAPLEARRGILAQLAKLSAALLAQSGHPASSDTMRRLTTTLEALAAYGGGAGAPPAGRLTSDVDPPGFEALASLVPRGGSSSRQASTPSRVIQFSQPKAAPTRRKATSEEDVRRLEAERKKKQAEARKVLAVAERALKEAARAVEQSRAAMKAAAARAKEAEKAKAAFEAQFEKLSAEAESTRQEARRVASQAEDAAQEMDDAERAVAKARTTLNDLTA
jgi:flagellar biosynthesis GTPase FlhF